MKAVIAITPGGAALARRLGARMPDAEVHLPESLRQEDGCRYFNEPLRTVLPRLFREKSRLVCIMATGIVVRLLAPHLRGKGSDPGVVVTDEGGRFAVSLLCGHLGGANELAREVARLCGGEAVITTATDVNGLPSWDESARLSGLAVDPLSHVRTLNGLLLRGERIALVDPGNLVAPLFAEIPGVEIYPNAEDALDSESKGFVLVTNRLFPDLDGNPGMLALRPRNLVVGIGCNRGTGAEEIAEAVTRVLEEALLSPLSIDSLSTITDKADEKGINIFAKRQGVPVEYHDAAALNEADVPGEPSPHALAAVGAKGVCEPAAILAAAGGPLRVKKKKMGNVTIAVAERIIEKEPEAGIQEAE